ncbi:MAG: cytochrome c, partial [bacterium]
DEWGAPIAPPDLTRRPLKVSNTPKALHRIIGTGIEGTPMPSYEDSLSEKEVWALVRFLESLVPKREWENMHAATPEERRGFMILRHHGREIR